jgi:hypothetical protein
MVLRTEYTDAAVRWCAVGLQPFVGLLTVIKTRCKTMDLDVRIFNQNWLRPFTSVNTETAFNVAIVFENKESV